MEQVSWWVRGFLGKYPEIMVSFACFLFLLFFRYRRRDGLPTNWPVVGSVPAISVNAGRVHEWLTEFLRVAPGMSHVARGPWGSPVDVLITANPADVAHVFTTNFGNYPKGEDFAAVFDVLGNGIFNADGDSWAFQRRKAHALLSDARFRAAVAASTARKLDEGLVPLLDGVAANADTNADGSDAADLLSLYMACQDELGKDGNELDRFLRDTTLNLMIAGRDTTSSALTWFFWLLTNHPDVEAKILAELRETLSSGGHPSAADLKRLVYLHAALSESLRLYPPVPFEHKAGARPDTLPSGPAVWPTRRVIVSFYSMGRMESVWGKDCLEFRPERWLTAAGRLRHEPSYKFVAFNVGPRTCLGKDLAFTQMKAVVAAVLPRFRVEVAPGAVVKPKLSIILHMKDGLKVRVYKRQDDAR
ncbi:unnamed protein product [Triticum turgidum subsp. durum]|uniref:Cytochrome P450 n=1 Tax=Triticum turgidum subsp. durum TaxID=4567 RepID=A0A9R1QAB1_TRITD|nr:unnamed protein product [Triticum turgidum subsp. durum]